MRALLIRLLLIILSSILVAAVMILIFGVGRECAKISCIATAAIMAIVATLDAIRSRHGIS